MSHADTSTRPRPTARKEPRMSVEEMLREIAYNLHVTRKLTAAEARPVRSDDPRPLVVRA